jgi:hypothetical protein
MGNIGKGSLSLFQSQRSDVAMRPKMKIEKMAEFFGQLISSKNLKKGRGKKSFAPCVETRNPSRYPSLPPSHSGAEPSGGQQPRRGASERKKTGERKGQVPSLFFFVLVLL